MQQYPFCLDVIRDICFNDENEINVLFKLVKATIEVDILSIKQSIKEQNISNLRNRVHNIKGMIFVLGNPYLNDVFVKANEVLSRGEFSDECKIIIIQQCIEESDALINQFMQWTNSRDFN
ncbi:hypothetical protein RGQ13_14650 [Thalassotalea psychrophila]|uniref:HPt domain-containing protein n=1 Tax=Thalassotalea psychrophila TaxID=3065647 RepID=A0ABY9TRH6_9GAMM|nr:hypothetical protein RGQ13_14650 [Colwelliaceae bacterium SQ149]